MAALSLNERVRIVGLNASLAQAAHDIWWTYHGPTRDEHLNTMQDFSEFFRFDEHSNRVAMIVGIWSLFDTTDDTITVRHIVCKAVADGHKTLRPLIARVDALQGDRRVAGVKLLRNKLFAHRDTKTGFDDAFIEAGLSGDDLRTLLLEVFEITREVADTIGAKAPVNNSIVPQHTAKMLRRLRRK